MKAECVPYSQIPHTTKLFSDFLSYLPPIHQFYPRSPYFLEWMKDEVVALRYDSDRRERVASILQAQNQTFGSSAKTLDNIARLRAGAAAVVTGQQVGLFGGPLYSIFKALTAVKLADLATQNGVDSVPVFWLATEDHDFAEINLAQLPGSDYSLQALRTTTNAIPDAPVGTVKFGEEISSVVETAAGLLGDSEALTALRESYQPGATFGSAYARLFARIFADWGVILLDPSDSGFHDIAKPLFHAAIEKSAELDNALMARGSQLEAAGYHQQVKVTPSSTLLFAVRNGVRTPIHRGNHGSTEFLIGDEQLSTADLLARIADAPANFNPNVLLRPVIQDYLLPTLAYTGGSAEVAYFAQAAVVYQSLLGRITPITPRFSATLVENKPRSLLDRYGLAFSDLFQGPDAARELLAKKLLSHEVQTSFDSANTAVETSMTAIRNALSALDTTLIDATDNAIAKMRHQLESLRSRAARAEVRQNEVITRKAQVLSNLLYPNKTLQEREISGIYFVARYGKGLLHDLYKCINADCLDHQVVTL